MGKHGFSLVIACHEENAPRTSDAHAAPPLTGGGRCIHLLQKQSFCAKCAPTLGAMAVLAQPRTPSTHNRPISKPILASKSTTIAVIANAVEFRLRGGRGVRRAAAGDGTAEVTGAPGDTGATAVAGANEGNTLAPLRQSGQPSRQMSASALTRPSASHLRMTSPAAGPY